MGFRKVQNSEFENEKKGLNIVSCIALIHIDFNYRFNLHHIFHHGALVPNCRIFGVLVSGKVQFRSIDISILI